jgi:hypothetical protein
MWDMLSLREEFRNSGSDFWKNTGERRSRLCGNFNSVVKLILYVLITNTKNNNNL